jgi:hypothetical protein
MASPPKPGRRTEQQSSLRDIITAAMRSATVFLSLLLLLEFARPTRSQEQTPAPATQAVPIDQEPHHHLVYANDDLRIFDIIVPPHESTLLHQHDNDYFFLVLGNSRVTAQVQGQAPVQYTFPDGAIHFSKAGFAHVMTNDSDQTFHNVAIEFLNPRITAGDCPCSSNPAAFACGCPNAPPLPTNWNLRIGQLQLVEETLAPGATINDTTTKNTRLLVAITPLDLLDVSTHEPKGLKVRLPVGKFHWLSPGPHQIQNLSEQPARFLSVAF